MIKKILISTVACFIASMIVFHSEQLYTKQAQPPTIRTGAPGENTCGTSTCHNAAPNIGSGNIQITFNGANGKYTPGQNYTLTFTVTQTGITRFGFEGTALTPTNSPAGIFTVQNPSTTSLQTGTNTRQYVGHKNANNNPNVNTWTVNWQAPTTNVGTVTVYACGISSNADGHSTGDQLYKTTLPIDCIFGAGVNDGSVDFAGLQLFVNANNALQLQCNTVQSGNMIIDGYNLSGVAMNHWEITPTSAGTFNQSLILSSGLPHGIYLFKLQVGNATSVKKVAL